MAGILLCDLFCTLVPGGGQEHSAVIERMGAALGTAPQAYRQEFERRHRERFTGEFGDLAGTLRQIALRIGGAPTEAQVEAACALRMAATASLISAAPATTLSTLARLRAGGWRLGLISNATPGSAELFRGSALAPLFEVLVFSDEVGLAKPDPAIYLTACQALAVAPAGCHYLGDGACDELSAARRLGMRAIRTTEHADTRPDWDGPTIAGFTDLPALLEGSPVHRGEVPGVR